MNTTMNSNPNRNEYGGGCKEYDEEYERGRGTRADPENKYCNSQKAYGSVGFLLQGAGKQRNFVNKTTQKEDIYVDMQNGQSGTKTSSSNKPQLRNQDDRDENGQFIGHHHTRGHLRSIYGPMATNTMHGSGTRVVENADHHGMRATKVDIAREGSHEAGPPLEDRGVDDDDVVTSEK